MLDKLLVALHPISFTPESDKYHIGYYTAQQEFRAVLTQQLNAGPLPTIQMTGATPVKRWKWW